MSTTTYADTALGGHARYPAFIRRWLFRTNHRDIGTLCLILAVCAAMLVGDLSAQLLHPGLIMIFFAMVLVMPPSPRFHTVIVLPRVR